MKAGKHNSSASCYSIAVTIFIAVQIGINL